MNELYTEQHFVFTTKEHRQILVACWMNGRSSRKTRKRDRGTMEKKTVSIENVRTLSPILCAFSMHALQIANNCRWMNKTYGETTVHWINQCVNEICLGSFHAHKWTQWNEYKILTLQRLEFNSMLVCNCDLITSAQIKCRTFHISATNFKKNIHIFFHSNRYCSECIS